MDKYERLARACRETIRHTMNARRADVNTIERKIGNGVANAAVGKVWDCLAQDFLPGLNLHPRERYEIVDQVKAIFRVHRDTHEFNDYIRIEDPDVLRQWQPVVAAVIVCKILLASYKVPADTRKSETFNAHIRILHDVG